MALLAFRIVFVFARTCLLIRKTVCMFALLALLLSLNACSTSVGATGKSTEHAEGIFTLKPFILNLLQGDAVYIKVSVAFELADPAFMGKAEAKTPQLRDAVIVSLSPKSKEDINNQEDRMQLKEDILLRANEILGKDTVRNVYFTDLVMQ